MRLLGISDAQLKTLGEASGLKPDAVADILRAAVDASGRATERAIKEVQSVIGPHGSVSRLQAGGVNISPIGINVYRGGVLKTYIAQDGNLRVGSDTKNPAYTSFCVFVDDQTYNNEDMGAGDILFGDNSTSNVKFDASAGQLQFRNGTDVQAYMDTNGSLKAGGGAVVLDEDGIQIPDGGDAIEFYESTHESYGLLSFRPQYDSVDALLQQSVFAVENETNQISNGDFETGDLTSWTTSGSITVASGTGYKGSYGCEFPSGLSYLQQNLASTSGTGLIVKFRAKTDAVISVAIEVSNSLGTSERVEISSTSEYRTYYAILKDTGTYVKLLSNANIFIDDITVRLLYQGSSAVLASTMSMNSTVIKLLASVTVILYAGWDLAKYLYINRTLGTLIEGGLTVNENGADADTRIEGDTDANLLFTDASADKVGIGKNNPSYKLDVAGDVNISSGSTYRINGTTVLSAAYAPREKLTANRTYYVRTDGSDSNDGLTNSSGGAFLTIAQAISTCQGIDLAGYTVTINIGSGTFSEAVDLKNINGGLTVQGTLSSLEAITSATVAAGSGATQGTVTKTGAFSGDSYEGKMVYFETDKDYRIIDSHTNDTLTLVGTAPSSTTQNVTIYDWGTTIAGGSSSPVELFSQHNVTIQYLKFTSSNSSGVLVQGSDTIYVHYCLLECPLVINKSLAFVYTSNINATLDSCLNILAGGVAYVQKCKIVTTGTNALVCQRIAFCSPREGTIITGASNGIMSQNGGQVVISNSSSTGYVRIRNCSSYAIYAQTGGQVIGTANNQYSGNGTNEGANATSFGYVD